MFTTIKEGRHSGRFLFLVFALAFRFFFFFIVIAFFAFLFLFVLVFFIVEVELHWVLPEVVLDDLGDVLVTFGRGEPLQNNDA